MDTGAVGSTAHLVAIDRTLTAKQSARRVAQSRYGYERTGQSPAERFAVDQTLNRPYRRSIYRQGFAAYFPAFLLEYPPCRPLEMGRPIHSERPLPRAGDIHQGQGVGGPVTPSTPETGKCQHDQEQRCPSPVADPKKHADHRLASSAFASASQAARCVARHGVFSHPVPVALTGECSIPVV